ncbi:MAG: acetyltransferase [Acidobacteriota bacterium]
MSAIIIIGAGGHGAVVADIVGDAIGFVDDSPQRIGTEVLGLPVFGTLAMLREFSHEAIVVAIGDNALRRAITDRVLAGGERLVSAIHPFTHVASSAAIGEGTVIAPGAVVMPRVVVGRGAIVNTKSSIDHDCAIGDFVHIAPGATLGGNVRVGDETLIGTGASVVAGVTIGRRCVIGAGAVVVRDLPDDVVAVGVPARITSGRRSETPPG